MSTVTSWSFSAWEQFTSCPAQFKYQRLDKLPTEDKAFFVKGRAAHKHLEKVVDFGEPIDPKIVLKEQLIAQELSTLRSPLKLVEQQWGFDDKWNIASWKAATLRVIADVLVGYGDGTGEIIDWKTGAKRDEGAWQMDLVATATFHRFPALQEVTSRLVYIEKGGQSISEHKRERLAERTDFWNAEFVKMKAERDFAPRPGFACRWCDFSREKKGPCRYG